MTGVARLRRALLLLALAGASPALAAGPAARAGRAFLPGRLVLGGLRGVSLFSPAVTPALSARSLSPGLPVFLAGPAAISPSSLVRPGVFPAAALRSLDQLAAPLKKERGTRLAGDRSGRVFDGAAPKEDGAEVPLDGLAEPETVTGELSGPAESQVLDLRFSRDAKERLKKDGLFASVRLVGGSGSRWYWNQFKKDATVRVLVGGQTLFVSRVASGETKAIGKLAKKDLAGVYPPEVLSRHTIAQLRRLLISDLTAYNRSAKPGAPAVVGLTSEVRVVRFLPYREACLLPENRDEPVYEPKPRRPAEVPAAMAGVQNFLPKAVLLDMRLFGDAVAPEFIEDMSKLMKAGVYFILLSDRKLDGPGSIEELLTKGLTSRQRDNFSRYKLLALSDGGNVLAAYRGLFPAALPMPRFSELDLDVMGFAASRLGAVSLSRGGASFSAALKPGTDAEAFARELERALRGLAVPSGGHHAVIGRDEKGRPTVTLRPNTLVSAIPRMLENLRDHEGLFVNPSDLLVISRDEDLLRATEGSVQAVRHTPAGGADLVDVSLAAMLGRYRENMPGDLAASASKIQAFLKGKDFAGGGGNVYMMMGHVMHSAFNWAVWIYRNTGVFPDADAVVARAGRNWAHEESLRTKNMVEHPGEAMDGYREVMEARLRAMRETVAGVLARFPIVIGTELPNIFVIERYKAGRLLHRDVLRLIYDFVAARETPRGLEVMILDFKTGQTSTLQNLAGDVQARLYDIAVRSLWENMPLPYASGPLKKVAKTGVTFIYPAGGYEPSLNEWSRIKYEKFLRQVMDRIRRHNNPPPAKPAGKKKKGKASAS